MIPFPDKKYKTVVIDPPWKLVKVPRKVRPRQGGWDYKHMTLDDIKSMSIQDVLDEDAWVFLWTTQKYLPHCFDILEEWELRYRFTMVWHKPGGFQPWGLPQYNGEFVVVGSRNKPKFLDLKKFNMVFDAPRYGHSVKPEEFYELLRRVTPEPRLDMFSRRVIEGFDSWGDEAPE